MATPAFACVDPSAKVGHEAAGAARTWQRLRLATTCDVCACGATLALDAVDQDALDAVDLSLGLQDTPIVEIARQQCSEPPEHLSRGPLGISMWSCWVTLVSAPPSDLFSFAHARKHMARDSGLETCGRVDRSQNNHSLITALTPGDEMSQSPTVRRTSSSARARPAIGPTTDRAGRNGRTESGRHPTIRHRRSRPCTQVGTGPGDQTDA